MMSSMPGLNKKQRQARARIAATARWSGSTSSLSRKKSPNQAYGEALVAAEKELAEAINERNFHAAEYHRLNRRIPELDRIVKALRGESGQPYAPQYQPPAPSYDIAQVMSDTPIPVQQPQIPEPQARPATHPMAGGGAVGGPVEEPDEDTFLKGTGLPGGEWR